MFTLKRYSIPCPEDEKDLFMFLYWDTQEADLAESQWSELVGKNPTYDRMWLGHVDRDNHKFEIRNTRAGLFKSRLSKFTIRGEVKRSIVSKTIEVEIGYGLPLITEALVSLIFATSIGMNLLTDFTSLLLIGIIMILLGVLLFDDFYGSEELILSYLKNPEKVSKLVVKK